MNGNRVRFLRKHKKQYYYQLGYSKILKKLEPEEYIYALAMFKHMPGRTNFVLNLMLTSHNHFGVKMNLDTLKYIHKHFDALEDYIRDYMYENRNKYGVSPAKVLSQNPTKRQAIKEQLARGFVKVKKWKYKDPKFSHIISNADPRLIYPMNLMHQFNEKRKYKRKHYLQVFPSIYHSHLGVAGWTRIVVPT